MFIKPDQVLKCLQKYNRLVLRIPDVNGFMLKEINILTALDRDGID